ncbi:MAG: formylmethanofuran dehydrogenase subunit E family protein [Proteobacteria bacterium]|nr:formylmethanofuran dehydrogenase subunit E family protein [Pseudomonadota bacterium]
MKEIKKLINFHGHKCPMSTIGYKAGLLAKKLLKLKRNEHKNAYAYVYYKSCAIDGIQIAFPATFGNNNIEVYNEQKMIFQFENKNTNTKVEIKFSNRLQEKLENYANIRSKAEREDSYLKLQKKVYKELYDFVLKTNPVDLFIVRFL